MPMQSMLLRPGVDVEQTLALNQAGISQSQLIRTKNGITQTMGGWEQFGPIAVPSTVRALHAWQDIAGGHATSPSSNGHKLLGVGGLQALAVVTETSYKDITPQIRASTFLPNFSISSGSNVVAVVDANAGLSDFDSVVFNTPVSIGNLLLHGGYNILAATSTGSYTITSSIAASTTIASSGILPTFTTNLNSQLVTVRESNNNAIAIPGLLQSFLIPTTVGGITIDGAYTVSSIVDSTDYIIISPMLAGAGATATMNNGNVDVTYYIAGAAPSSGGLGYGRGGYGRGGYGTGASPPATPGTPITVTDWTLDNWGEILLACQEDGPVFQWSPGNNFACAQIIVQAPLLNMGAFISMPQQILVLWGSTQSTGTHDHLIVRWSDAGDFTNWTVAPDTAAGSFHIPTGSAIRGGLQASNYGVIWTDVDCWIMQYTNDPVSIFNFTRAASGCGLIGRHAAGVLAGSVYWCSEANFYVLTGTGVDILPCTVWDFIFQNINRDQQQKVCIAPNSEFNEIGWFFPFGTATENNAYVKFNLMDKTWDYGFLERTAWTDVSILGAPIGTDTGSYIWKHETGNRINGAGNSYFRTGWWTISDGEDLAFIDWVHPDFIWGTDGDDTGAVKMTFFTADYPGDTPRVYGPFTVTKANQYISPRMRGRLAAFEAQSATNDMFFRLGRVRYRWAPAGRR